MPEFIPPIEEKEIGHRSRISLFSYSKSSVCHNRPNSTVIVYPFCVLHCLREAGERDNSSLCVRMPVHAFAHSQYPVVWPFVVCVGRPS